MYFLSCRDCPAQYIGETGGSFAAQFCDHLSAYVNKKPTRSAYAAHLIDTDHVPGNEQVLPVECNFRRRTALENNEIGMYSVQYCSTGKFILVDWWTASFATRLIINALVYDIIMFTLNLKKKLSLK